MEYRQFSKTLGAFEEKPHVDGLQWIAICVQRGWPCTRFSEMAKSFSENKAKSRSLFIFISFFLHFLR